MYILTGSAGVYVCADKQALLNFALAVFKEKMPYFYAWQTTHADCVTINQTDDITRIFKQDMVYRVKNIIVPYDEYSDYTWDRWMSVWETLSSEQRKHETSVEAIRKSHDDALREEKTYDEMVVFRAVIEPINVLPA